MLMWELWSECSVPYFLKTQDDDVAKFVLDGGRLEKPEDCPQAVYEVMLKCWHQSAKNTPTFNELRFLMDEAAVTIRTELHLSRHLKKAMRIYASSASRTQQFLPPFLVGTSACVQIAQGLSSSRAKTAHFAEPPSKM
mmetsp:Transcript_32476/g.79759  ORF Transcript_32476/g.79759 Transcript_32476/m.79759 type:complete len:138 (-) Transcript_32476:72-485(-)